MVPSPGPVKISHKKMAGKGGRIDFMFLGAPPPLPSPWIRYWNEYKIVLKSWNCKPQLRYTDLTPSKEYLGSGCTASDYWRNTDCMYTHELLTEGLPGEQPTNLQRGGWRQTHTVITAWNISRTYNFSQLNVSFIQTQFY